jgi:outer membrane protein TolC
MTHIPRNASFFLLVAGICAAQSPPLLTLDDCIRLATDAPSAVATARQQVIIARYGITAAKANFYPLLSLQSGYLYNTPPSAFQEGFQQRFISLNNTREYITMGQADLLIDSSGRTRAEVARARADQQRAEVGVRISQRDIRRLVTTAYYRLLLARRLVRVTRDAAMEAQRFQELTNTLFGGGEVAQADVIKSSADVAFQLQAVNNAELEAQLANHDLASFWTTDTATDLNIEDLLDVPAPAPPMEETNQPYLQRPELAALDADRSILLADVRRTRADLLPQMRLTYQYGIDATRYNFNDRGQAIIASVSVPIFDWSRTRSTMAQFSTQAEQVQTNRAAAERTFARDYQDALARVRQVHRTLELTQAQVTLSTENLRLARIRYQGGEGLALDVVAAQNQLAQASANQYTAKANYFNARAELEVTAGR